jgi:hypothetical protein
MVHHLGFFHGWPGSRLDFAPNDGAAKETGARVIAFGRPEIGGSDPQPGRRRDPGTSARSTTETLGELVDPRSQLTDLDQYLGFDIARGLALRTRYEPARDRRRDDREQREPA